MVDAPRPPSTDPGDLMARLAEMLAPEPLEPPAEGLAALRRALGSRPAAGRTESGRHRRPIRWRRPVTAAGIAVGALVGGSGVAFAVGAAPEPVRAVAYDIGLPVASPALSAARDDEDDLRKALGTSPSPTVGQAQKTAAEAGELSRQISHLDQADRRKLGPTPLRLITEARTLEASRDLPPTPLPDPGTSWWAGHPVTTPDPGRPSGPEPSGSAPAAGPEPTDGQHAAYGRTPGGTSGTTWPTGYYHPPTTASGSGEPTTTTGRTGYPYSPATGAWPQGGGTEPQGGSSGGTTGTHGSYQPPAPTGPAPYGGSTGGSYGWDSGGSSSPYGDYR